MIMFNGFLKLEYLINSMVIAISNQSKLMYISNYLVLSQYLFVSAIFYVLLSGFYIVVCLSSLLHYQRGLMEQRSITEELLKKMW